MPPPELQAEWDGKDEDKNKRIKSEMAKTAQYGEPSRVYYQSNDQLRQISADAQLWYWVPRAVLVEPDTKSDRVLASYLRSLLPILHGAIWQFRQTPADIALDPTTSKVDAERKAVRWSLNIRELLHQLSQARPLTQGDAATSNVWQETFMFRDSSSSVSEENGPNAAGVGGAVGGSRSTEHSTGGEYYLWHLIRKCTQSRCGRIHGCPICKECQDRPAPLAWHLGQMKKPQKITLVGDPPKDIDRPANVDQQGVGAPSGGRGNRPRSRSPRRNGDGRDRRW